tara:strand:+ start:435 stop:1526 length:1092 start_codon:yes stop_codon:yes gene_type:complete
MRWLNSWYCVNNFTELSTEFVGYLINHYPFVGYTYKINGFLRRGPVLRSSHNGTCPYGLGLGIGYSDKWSYRSQLIDTICYFIYDYSSVELNTSPQIKRGCQQMFRYITNDYNNRPIYMGMSIGNFYLQYHTTTNNWICTEYKNGNPTSLNYYWTSALYEHITDNQHLTLFWAFGQENDSCPNDFSDFADINSRPTIVNNNPQYCYYEMCNLINSSIFANKYDRFDGDDTWMPILNISGTNANIIGIRNERYNENMIKQNSIHSNIYGGTLNENLQINISLPSGNFKMCGETHNSYIEQLNFTVSVSTPPPVCVSSLQDYDLNEELTAIDCIYKHLSNPHDCKSIALNICMHEVANFISDDNP